MSAAPLVLIPGAFCDGWAFDAWRPALEASGRCCTALDLPRDPALWRSLTDFASVVAEAAGGNAEPPVLVGHSMGGLLAQLAAARLAAAGRPVAGLVLLAPSPPWGQPVVSGLEVASGPILAAVLGPYWLGEVEPDWPVMRGYTLDRLPEAEARAIYARMRPESGRALYEVLNWWADPTMAAYVPPMHLPTLVITGELDRVHSPPSTALTAHRLGGRHLVLPGVSHWTVGGPGTEAGLRGMLEWLDAL